ncbi:MAG TPA: SUF system NifU family Fe-S cluster assembly protein [Acidimicrobiales bacterium]|nr:SUF system NifU family Fe-S cluster assembly protein [Acidimicrobiales bacterium]
MADLEELYREIILDHYRSPRNRGELESPPAHRVEGFNPLCGDEVVLSMLVEGDTLADLKIAGSGCSISQSSASLMSAAVKGKPVDQVRQLISTFKGMMSVHEASLGHEAHDGHGHGHDGSAPAALPHQHDGNGAEVVPGEPEEIDLDKLGELAALQGVVKFPVRIKCATLSWNALAQGLDEVAAGA